MNITVSTDIPERMQALWDALVAQHGEHKWDMDNDAWQTILEVILTQSAGWANVQKSMMNLKGAGIWTPAEIRGTEPERLEQLLRPSRFYRSKTKKVQAFANHLKTRTLAEMFEQPIEVLREELLSIHGIGPESADTIILYAAQKPSFVVDAYTHRILSRLGWVSGNLRYAQLRDFFMHHITPDVQAYNGYHALFVRHGAQICHQREPDCKRCNLRVQCDYFNLRSADEHNTFA